MLPVQSDKEPLMDGFSVAVFFNCLSWKILDHASLTEKMKLRSKEFPPSYPLPFLVP